MTKPIYPTEVILVFGGGYDSSYQWRIIRDEMFTKLQYREDQFSEWGPVDFSNGDGIGDDDLSVICEMCKLALSIKLSDD